MVPVKVNGGSIWTAIELSGTAGNTMGWTTKLNSPKKNMLLKVVPLMVALPKPRFGPIVLLMLIGVPLGHTEQSGALLVAAPVAVIKKFGPINVYLVLAPEIPAKS